MAFNYLTQQQGPTVPISLFGQAATQGAALGQSLGTPVSNIIEGAVKGFQTGMQIKSELQQQEIRDIQIQNAPLDTRVKQQQAEALEIANQANRLRLDNAVLTNGQQLEAAKAKLSFDTANLNNKTQIFDLSKEFRGVMDSKDPEAMSAALFGGKYGAVFNANPKEYERGLQEFYPFAGPERQNLIAKQLKLISNTDKAETEARAATDRLNGNLQVMETTNQSYKTALAKFPEFTPQQLTQGLQVVNGGTYTVGPNGRAILNAAGTAPLMNPQDKQQRGTFETWMVNPSDPKDVRLVNPNADPKDKDNFINVQKDIGFLKGRSRYVQTTQQGLNDEAPKVARRQTYAQAAQVATQVNTPTPAPVQAEVLHALAKTSLNVSDATATKLVPNFEALSQLVDTYSANVTSRTNLAVNADMARVIDDIGRSVAEDQYNSNPAIREKFDRAAVERYNAQIDLSNDVRQRQAPISSVFGTTPEDAAYSQTIRAIVDVNKVNSPLDLYYITQVQGAVKAKLDPVVIDLMKFGYERYNREARQIASDRAIAANIANAAKGNFQPATPGVVPTPSGVQTPQAGVGAAVPTATAAPQG